MVVKRFTKSKDSRIGEPCQFFGDFNQNKRCPESRTPLLSRENQLLEYLIADADTEGKGVFPIGFLV